MHLYAQRAARHSCLVQLKCGACYVNRGAILGQAGGRRDRLDGGRLTSEGWGHAGLHPGEHVDEVGNAALALKRPLPDLGLYCAAVAAPVALKGAVGERQLGAALQQQCAASCEEGRMMIILGTPEAPCWGRLHAHARQPNDTIEQSQHLLPQPKQGTHARRASCH